MATPIPLHNGANASETSSAHDLPPVPAKPAAADEIARITKSLEKGLEDSATRPRIPTGIKRLGETNKTPPADVATPTAAASQAPPERPASPPTQSSLSAGYAKLTRQQKALARREAELETRSQSLRGEHERIEAEKKQVEEAKQAWQKEQAAKLEELSLLDTDEVQWIERYAKRKGTTPRAVYDKLMRRVLNDGAPHPDDVQSELKQELDELKQKVSGEEEERKKREASATEEAKRRAEAEAVNARIIAEQRTMLSFVLTGEGPAKYPLLSKEPPEDIAAISYQLGTDYFARTGKGATFDMVAAHLEKQLQDQKDLEEYRKSQAGAQAPAQARAATSADTETDEEEEVSERGNGAVTKPAKPETRTVKGTSNGLKKKERASGPRTLTNGLASQRASGPMRNPRDDNERLDRALAAWHAR